MGCPPSPCQSRQGDLDAPTRLPLCSAAVLALAAGMMSCAASPAAAAWGCPGLAATRQLARQHQTCRHDSEVRVLRGTLCTLHCLRSLCAVQVKLAVACRLHWSYLQHGLGLSCIQLMAAVLLPGGDACCCGPALSASVLLCNAHCLCWTRKTVVPSFWRGGIFRRALCQPVRHRTVVLGAGLLPAVWLAAAAPTPAALRAAIGRLAGAAWCLSAGCRWPCWPAQTRAVSVV